MTDQRGELVIVMGAPGSGKSTFIKELFDAQHEPARLVSSDAIRAELLKSVSDMTANHAVMQLFRHQITEGLYNNEIVFADATFSNAVLRREFMAQMMIHADMITGYVMNTLLETCLERNRNRPAFVPEKVIIKMYNALLEDPPSLDEGFTVLRWGQSDGAPDVTQRSVDINDVSW